MKHIVTAITIAAILTTGIWLFHKKQTPSTGITIGILQTASHPALDAACKGFQAELRAHLGTSVHFKVKNAQGLIANMHTIAQSFTNDQNIDAILAIATPAAQAIAHIEHNKPIFITAVTDPAGLGLLGPQSNVCGASDMVNNAKTAELATALAPQARIAAVMFSISEASSATMAAQLHAHLTKRGLRVIDIGISQETDLPAALNKACSAADIIITPLDNLVASTITFIAAHTKRAKKPLIVSDNLLVGKGALAAAGVDYTIAGKQAAQCAVQVFVKHKKPHEIALAYQTGSIVINQTVLDQCGLSLPKNLAQSATIISGEQS